MKQPNHLQLVTERPPRRSVEVSPQALEDIVFDAACDGVVVEISRPEGAGWRRATVQGQRYHAWQNAVAEVTC